MQKVLLPVAAAAALVFASFGAHAESDGAFVNVGVGSSRYDINRSSFDDKKDTAIGVVGGYRWAVDRPFFLGVEAGYVDLGKMSNRYDYVDAYVSDHEKAEFTGKAILIGVNGKWELPHYWTITARLGLAHSRTESKIDYTVSSDVYGYSFSDRARQSSNDNGIYAGLGFGYDFTPEFGVTVNYDHYALKAKNITDDKRTVNVSVWGVAAEYRF